MSLNVIWPAGYEPDGADVYAENNIETSATPREVWDRLIRAPRWPEYYPNASTIELPEGADALALGMTFYWVTAGVRLATTVKEFVPEQRISWEAIIENDPTSLAYHAWVLEPSATGTHIYTEETQKGPYWQANAKARPGGLHRVHQQWVEELAKAAESDSGVGR